jgi:hypothetical protein
MNHEIDTLWFQTKNCKVDGDYLKIIVLSEKK